MRSADIFLFGRLAGRLVEYDEGGYSFRYDSGYLSLPDAQPLSFSLPLRPEPFPSRFLHSFFDGLIPEGWLLDIAEETWKINPRDRMGLLLACCRDCIGAASVREAGQ